MGCCGGGGYRVKSMPSLGKQIANLTLSVANVIAHAIKTGAIRADDATITKRVGVCQSCRQLQGLRCATCGCYVHIKTGIQKEKCPLGKW